MRVLRWNKIGWNKISWLLVALMAVVAGCASGSDAKPTTYAGAAEQRYQSAQENLDDSDYIEAIREFNSVRNKFPYSKYASLSELRIGDAYFDQEKYASAVEQYRNFLQLHPKHPEVAYANWRVALSFYKLMPEDWWLLPPSYERDLAKTRDAVREMSLFVKRYPDSKYTERANKLVSQARRRLADHELYVAKFYLDRENPRASAMRLRYLLENYSGLGLDPQALFLLARSYIELGDGPKARTALEDLVEYHPNTELAQEAQEYLAQHDLK
jgi:outer membrane protein assembly factor BamD